MIGDNGNSRFMGFGLMSFWVFGCLIFFFFFVGFGCDCGLWLKWQFGGYVGGGCGCRGLCCWLWLCWWWFDFFFFFFSCCGLCWVMVVAVLVVVT